MISEVKPGISSAIEVAASGTDYEQLGNLLQVFYISTILTPDWEQMLHTVGKSHHVRWPVIFIWDALKSLVVCLMSDGKGQ